MLSKRTGQVVIVIVLFSADRRGDFSIQRFNFSGWGLVSPPHLCLGGLVQYRLNVDSRALLAKMPLFGIGLASDHSQLLLHRLVLAAEIANIDCGHERSPFSLMMPCRVPGLGSSGTAGVGRKRPASLPGLER